MAKFEFRILCVSDDVRENIQRELKKSGFEHIEETHSIACDLKSNMTFPDGKIAQKRAQSFYDSHKDSVQEILVIRK